MSLEDIFRATWHCVLILLFFGIFYLGWRLLRRPGRLGLIAFLSAIPTWLLLPFHPVALGIAFAAAWLGYLMERGPGSFPIGVGRRNLNPEAWQIADAITDTIFGSFWHTYAVPIFLFATWCFNLLYDYLWLSGLSGGRLFVVGMLGFGYGSTIGLLFSRKAMKKGRPL